MHEPFITRETIERAAFIPETEHRTDAWVVEDFFRGAPLPDEEQEALRFFSGLVTGLVLSAVLGLVIFNLARVIL